MAKEMIIRLRLYLLFAAPNMLSDSEITGEYHTIILQMNEVKENLDPKS